MEHCVKAGKFTWEGLRAKGLIFEQLNAITGQHIQVHGTKILYGDEICRICLSSSLSYHPSKTVPFLVQNKSPQGSRYKMLTAHRFK